MFEMLSNRYKKVVYKKLIFFVPPVEERHSTIGEYTKDLGSDNFVRKVVPLTSDLNELYLLWELTAQEDPLMMNAWVTLDQISERYTVNASPAQDFSIYPVMGVTLNKKPYIKLEFMSFKKKEKE